MRREAKRAIHHLAFVVVMLRSGVALADDEQVVAGQFFQAGLAAYAHHDYKAAARAFEEANRHAPRAASMFNAGLALEAAGEDTRAADAYAAALAGGELQGPDAEKAHHQLDALEAALGVVRIVAPVSAKASLAHVVSATIPVAVHVHPGEYVVTVARGDGASGTQRVRVQAGAAIDVSVRMPEESPPSRAPNLTPPPALRRSNHPTATWGWITLGGAGAVAAAAGVLGIEGLRARDAFEASGETSVSSHGRAATYRTLANVGWGVAGAATIGGVVLLTLRSASRATTTSEVVLSPAGAELRCRF